MSQDELDKLRAKVERDPDSKLFLPLAEEYRKQGMLSEALEVLLNGLDRQSGYTSARVTLGKVYLEMNMPNDAKVEFERVIDAVPDNLFVHRKLAELYRHEGETDKAVIEYRKVLELNPYDEDAKSFLDLLESSKTAPEASSALTGEPLFAERLSEGTAIEDISCAETGPLSEVNPVEAEDVSGVFEEEFEDFKNFLSEEEQAAEAGEGAFSTEDTDGSAGALSPVSEAAERTDEFAETYPEDPSGMPGCGEVESLQKEKDFSYADSMVVNGEYYNAIKAYNEILSDNPDNRHIQQRLAELKAYLEMTGEGNDILISRLSLFLEEARKRKRL